MMADVNYEKLVGIISRASGLPKEEIEGKVDAKIKKISGLISKEGAAQIVAAELGISFDNERLKIDELSSGMKRVNFVGKVVNVFPVRTFVRNGQEGKVANLVVADETSNTKTVLWDTSHIGLIESGTVSQGSIIEILNASVKDNEVHLGSFSGMKLSSEVLNDVKTERVAKEKNISDFRISENAVVRAFVVQAFEPKFFDVCIECKKKVDFNGQDFSCKEHGKTASEKRALMNIVLDDGTGTIRTVLFHDSLMSLGFTELGNPDFLIQKKQELLGKEMFFSGSVRTNKFFNEPEFVISDAREINIDEITAKLES
ncbi:MAG: hypothetical protein AABX28_01645 [Nanoarchaeota archaeon]